MAGCPEAYYCVSSWVMVALCTCLACWSLFLLALVTRINCSWFKVESHYEFLVFGSRMVCAVAGREF
jgi:hypothetical protein